MGDLGPGFAPAKINLTLHVTGQDDRGYHLLDSLVVFADVGDHLLLAPEPGVTITGPMAKGVPTDDSNLVMQVARAFGASVGVSLDKHLPAAAGIGGGSSDAAAMARLLAGAGYAMPSPDVLLSLGADIPVCMAAPRPTRMRGIGEKLYPVEGVPECWLVLINPGVPVPTGRVFAGLESKANPPMGHGYVHWPDAAHFADWLAVQRNDLEAPAIALQPVIGDVIATLAKTKGCHLARMSGSGATCFGLYADQATAAAAAAEIQSPGWWVQAARVM